MYPMIHEQPAGLPGRRAPGRGQVEVGMLPASPEVDYHGDRCRAARRDVAKRYREGGRRHDLRHTRLVVLVTIPVAVMIAMMVTIMVMPVLIPGQREAGELGVIGDA